MGTETLHDLTAAYALDALDADERREYEAHLARCEHCRNELTAMSETAGALAFGVDAPEPPPALRTRILEQARADRANVAPLRPRWAVPAVITAAAAVAAAIVLAVWASSLSNKVNRLEAQRNADAAVARIIATPGARRIAIGNQGTLVVTPSHSAALVLTELRPAGRGMLYEAWVAKSGAPKPAGTFQSAGSLTSVRLERDVPQGATVLVTRQTHRTNAPTSSPFIRVTA